MANHACVEIARRAMRNIRTRQVSFNRLGGGHLHSRLILAEHRERRSYS